MVTKKLKHWLGSQVVYRSTVISQHFQRKNWLMLRFVTFLKQHTCLYIGRGQDYVAMEASLKLKEISYINVKVCGWELKHERLLWLKIGHLFYFLSRQCRQPHSWKYPEVVARGLLRSSPSQKKCCQKPQTISFLRPYTLTNLNGRTNTISRLLCNPTPSLDVDKPHVLLSLCGRITKKSSLTRLFIINLAWKSYWSSLTTCRIDSRLMFMI